MTGRIRRGLALIPEDRQREGLVSILSVAANLTMASLRKFLVGFHISAPSERSAIARAIRDLSIKVADPAQEVASLSGGNQQKVVIGKALMTDPKVLLMDEPSRGIDVGAKAEVFRTMRRLAAQGLGIIFVTSDLDEVHGAQRPHRGHEQRPRDGAARSRRGDRSRAGRGLGARSRTSPQPSAMEKRA